MVPESQKNAINRASTEQIKNHITFLNRMVGIYPSQASFFLEEIAYCEKLIEDRKKPKEPDICDIIEQESN